MIERIYSIYLDKVKNSEHKTFEECINEIKQIKSEKVSGKITSTLENGNFFEVDFTKNKKELNFKRI